MDWEIERIFKELDIDGGIYPLEEESDYWKRKLIETYQKTKDKMVERFEKETLNRETMKELTGMTDEEYVRRSSK